MVQRSIDFNTGYYIYHNIVNSLFTMNMVHFLTSKSNFIDYVGALIKESPLF